MTIPLDGAGPLPPDSGPSPGFCCKHNNIVLESDDCPQCADEARREGGEPPFRTPWFAGFSDSSWGYALRVWLLEFRNLLPPEAVTALEDLAHAAVRPAADELTRLRAEVARLERLNERWPELRVTAEELCDATLRVVGYPRVAVIRPSDGEVCNPVPGDYALVPLVTLLALRIALAGEAALPEKP